MQKIINHKTNQSDFSESNTLQVEPSICASSDWSSLGLDDDSE